MLKAFLSRLWQQVTQGFARPQADSSLVVLDEAEANVSDVFHQKVIAKCKELGYDIQPVGDDASIGSMNKAVWVGSGAERLQLGTYVKWEDFKALSKRSWPNLSQHTSASQHFGKSPTLRKAYEKAIEAFLKCLGS